MAYSRQVSNSESFREQALSGFPDCVGIHVLWPRVPELWRLAVARHMWWGRACAYIPAGFVLEMLPRICFYYRIKGKP
jgi:hypothetical protein